MPNPNADNVRPLVLAFRSLSYIEDADRRRGKPGGNESRQVEGRLVFVNGVIGVVKTVFHGPWPPVRSIVSIARGKLEPGLYLGCMGSLAHRKRGCAVRYLNPQAKKNMMHQDAAGFAKRDDYFLKSPVMKKKIAIVSLAASVLLVSMLAGCDTRNQGEEVRSVDWYESHDTERAAKLTECMANPGTLDGTPNCVNASRAENSAKAGAKWGTESEGVRTTPPITN